MAHNIPKLQHYYPWTGWVANHHSCCIQNVKTTEEKDVKDAQVVGTQPAVKYTQIWGLSYTLVNELMLDGERIKGKAPFLTSHGGFSLSEWMRPRSQSLHGAIGNCRYHMRMPDCNPTRTCGMKPIQINWLDFYRYRTNGILASGKKHKPWMERLTEFHFK